LFFLAVLFFCFGFFFLGGFFEDFFVLVVGAVALNQLVVVKRASLGLTDAGFVGDTSASAGANIVGHKFKN
jgi:hypothetical protein